MVTKLKKDGLDNVHTEAAQVSVTSQKWSVIQLNLIPENLYFHYNCVCTKHVSLCFIYQC